MNDPPGNPIPYATATDTRHPARRVAGIVGCVCGSAAVALVALAVFLREVRDESLRAGPYAGAGVALALAGILAGVFDLPRVPAILALSLSGLALLVIWLVNVL